mmetsp:Transcript_61365/g.173064  ORF Transcript_61365/g.173064 Transcript_61365/m.173064 type:complete len:345 (+) Transcript_61365:152-1186(+)
MKARHRLWPVSRSLGNAKSTIFPHSEKSLRSTASSTSLGKLETNTLFALEWSLSPPLPLSAGGPALLSDVSGAPCCPSNACATAIAWSACASAMALAISRLLAPWLAPVGPTSDSAHGSGARRAFFPGRPCERCSSSAARASLAASADETTGARSAAGPGLPASPPPAARAAPSCRREPLRAASRAANTAGEQPPGLASLARPPPSAPLPGRSAPRSGEPAPGQPPTSLSLETLARPLGLCASRTVTTSSSRKTWWSCSSRGSANPSTENIRWRSGTAESASRLCTNPARSATRTRPGGKTNSIRRSTSAPRRSTSSSKRSRIRFPCCPGAEALRGAAIGRIRG